MKQKVKYSKNLIGQKRRSVWDEISTVLFIFVMAVFVIFIAFSRIYTGDEIKGESMEPTYYSGDIVYFAKTKNITYGDNIIIKSGSKDIIKRVIGLAGDTIEIKLDVVGYYRVFRNGEMLNETYLGDLEGNTKKHDEFVAYHGSESVVVGAGEVFVLGDNRANSNDSAQHGCFSVNDIVGRVDYYVEKGKTPMLDLFVQFFLPIFK